MTPTPTTVIKPFWIQAANVKFYYDQKIKVKPFASFICDFLSSRSLSTASFLANTSFSEHPTPVVSVFMFPSRMIYIHLIICQLLIKSYTLSRCIIPNKEVVLCTPLSPDWFLDITIFSSYSKSGRPPLAPLILLSLLMWTSLDPRNCLLELARPNLSPLVSLEMPIIIFGLRIVFQLYISSNLC